MINERKALRSLLIGAGVILFLFLLMQPLLVGYYRQYADVLFPHGIIGLEERNLLLIIQGIMLLVILPVYFLTFYFSWKYSAHNPKGKYNPDLVDNHLAEILWWAIPFVLTAVIAVLTWVKTHELDPYKPLVSDKKPLTVQVVALNWKWLFIYPEQKIATVNFLQIPENTPIHFLISADAPMNSFWIPRLGGQIYAMAGMKTELYLIADRQGDFRGCSANLSGEGFSGMHFITRSSSEEDFNRWVEESKQTPLHLNDEEYAKLAAPSKDSPAVYYQLDKEGLFDEIVSKYLYMEAK